MSDRVSRFGNPNRWSDRVSSIFSLNLVLKFGALFFFVFFTAFFRGSQNDKSVSHLSQASLLSITLQPPFTKPRSIYFTLCETDFSYISPPKKCVLLSIFQKLARSYPPVIHSISTSYPQNPAAFSRILFSHSFFPFFIKSQNADRFLTKSARSS